MKFSFSPLKGGSLILTLFLAGCATKQPVQVDPHIIIVSSDVCPVRVELGKCSDLADATTCKKLIKLNWPSSSCEHLDIPQEKK